MATKNMIERRLPPSPAQPLRFSRKSAAIAGVLGLLLPALLSTATACLAYFPIEGILPGLGLIGRMTARVLPVGAVFLGLNATLLLMVAAAAWIVLGGLVFAMVNLNWRPAALAIAAVFGMAAGFVPGALAFHHLKLAGYALLGWRSEPLVQAIKAYERANGAPPGELGDLVPKYLASVPGTGMAAYPDYEYAAEAGPCLDGNRWHLKVDAGELLQWDFFFYCPHEVYGVEGWGGYNEVIGKWAYLHE